MKKWTYTDIFQIATGTSYMTIQLHYYIKYCAYACNLWFLSFMSLSSKSVFLKMDDNGSLYQNLSNYTTGTEFEQ